MPLQAGRRLLPHSINPHLPHVIRGTTLFDNDHGIPILVTGVSTQRVTKLSTGPILVAATDARTGFWEFLHGWGGTWMWEVIKPSKDTPVDVLWIIEGLQEGSLIWTTDRLYDRKRAVDLSVPKRDSD